MIWLTEHFTRQELACKCGCDRCETKPELLGALEELRRVIGRPIHITSGYRCPEHNAAVGGAPHSQHCQGAAVDCHVHGMTPGELAEAAEAVPDFAGGGIGVYSSWAHLDVRGVRARWIG